MKILLLILLLSKSDGSIQNAVPIKAVESIIACQALAASVLSENPPPAELNVNAVPICIDSTRVGVLHKPTGKAETL